MKNLEQIPSPCFVIEEGKLISNLKLIDSVQRSAGVKIILAFKGFAMWSMFPLVRQYLSGATASSLHEALLCSEYMKSKAHTYCVAYDNDTFDQVAELSSHLTFNSLHQFERFKSKTPKGVSIGLRVNPEWSDVATDLYNPASPTSRLGVTRENMPDELPQEIEGLHFHVLCESSAESLAELLRRFEQSFGNYLPSIKWLNLGGGHLMTRTGYDQELLINTLNDFREKHQIEIILEPGSAIAWETGFLRAKVLDVVESGGEQTAIADISFTCHMPDCLEMPYKPRITGAKSDPTHSAFSYRIGGVSCLAGDFMSAYGFDTAIQVGDQLIFEDMVHYTMVKTSTFNGVQHPSIGVIRTSGDFELIRAFGYNDFKQRLS
ncbi:MAG: carboxynorspermidine decarboxylase [Cyclobacteriaceae bacterium]|jgi:carboxynorspermidine decarboxylase